MEVVYVSYEEAQKLIPIFEHAAKRAPYKEAQESAKRLLQELKLVRPLDYGPLRGRQVFLHRDDDKDFLVDALNEIG